jgi:hypothetical protein
MLAYDSKKPQQSRMNFLDLASRTTNLFEPEPLNSFNSIDAVILEPEEPLEAYVWEEPQAVSPWNSDSTEAAKYRGGLQIDDPVFKDSWTKYYGLHVDCEEEEVCYCEHNCGGTHTTKGQAVINSDTTVKPQTTGGRILLPTISQVSDWNNYGTQNLEKEKRVETEIPAIVLTTPSNHVVFIG